MFDVSGSTVRRWASQFEEHLSGGANPGKGAYRAFTDDDLRVLAYVHERTTAGIPVAEIQREIATATLPTLSDLMRGRGVATDDTFVEGLTALVASSTDTTQQIAATLERLADLQALRDEIAQLRRRIEILERSRHRHRDRFPYRAYDDTHEP